LPKLPARMLSLSPNVRFHPSLSACPVTYKITCADVVMTILALVRNFVPAHEQVVSGEWNVAAVAKEEYDLEDKVVGTVAVGRIGERVLRRLKGFDCKELLYFDYQVYPPPPSPHFSRYLHY